MKSSEQNYTKSQVKLSCTFAKILELFRATVWIEGKCKITLPYTVYFVQKNALSFVVGKKIVEAHQSKRLSFDVSPHYNP